MDALRSRAYTPDPGTCLPWVAQEIAEFRAALRTLWIAYQPIVRASNSAVVAYEALVRTRHPRLGNPRELLQAAERLGLLGPLGREIRRRAVLPFRRVPEHVQVFLNVHPVELLDPDVVPMGGPVADQAHRVVLEITEPVPFPDLADAGRAADRLRARGFRLALDDLGAGYSGLTTFAALEPEVVKLDMALTKGAQRSRTGELVVRSVVDLCEALSVRVVAEGVETEEARESCVDMGCDLLQGYLFGKPRPSLLTAQGR